MKVWNYIYSTFWQLWLFNVDEFLLNVKNRTERSNTNFFIKRGYSLENIQPPSIENEQPIRNSRSCSANAYQTKSFNDFIYFNLKESVLSYK